jgi:hypothetical protein
MTGRELEMVTHFVGAMPPPPHQGAADRHLAGRRHRRECPGRMRRAIAVPAPRCDEDSPADGVDARYQAFLERQPGGR